MMGKSAFWRSQRARQIPAGQKEIREWGKGLKLGCQGEGKERMLSGIQHL